METSESVYSEVKYLLLRAWIFYQNMPEWHPLPLADLACW